MKATIIATWSWGRSLVVKGMEVLKEGGTALDALEEGIRVVEDDPQATTVGLGGLPNLEGVVELDASIMDGRSLKAGAVGGVRGIRHPISVARRVLELAPHILLVGEGAERFAELCGFPREEACKPGTVEEWRRVKAQLDSLKADVDHASTYLEAYRKFLRARMDQGILEPLGTVSAVALDRYGNIASGNSTTGVFMKIPGRVGDSAIIGAGIYADNRVGGASATGTGEIAITHTLSKTVCDHMKDGVGVQEACERAISKTSSSTLYGGGVAVIALDREGRPGAASSMKHFVYVYGDEEVEDLSPRTPAYIAPKRLT